MEMNSSLDFTAVIDQISFKMKTLSSFVGLTKFYIPNSTSTLYSIRLVPNIGLLNCLDSRLWGMGLGESVLKWVADSSQAKTCPAVST
jgi:hypothetical protein